MNSTALITGASKGIGAELARIFASKNTNLALVARSEKELTDLKEQLETQFGISVMVITKDLAKPESVQEVFDEIKSAGVEVDYLVNNAGFGDFGTLTHTDWKRYEQMINLNVSALSHLCYLFAKEWQGRKSGKIMNVASTAAFQPGPKMAVYFASKSYVLSFSQAIGNELRQYGITVTALCPGPTETNFLEAAHMQPNGLLMGRKLPSAKDVAQFGYKAMMKGKPVAIHGFLNRFVANFVRFLPRKMVVKLSEKVLST